MLGLARAAQREVGTEPGLPDVPGHRDPARVSASRELVGDRVDAATSRAARPGRAAANDASVAAAPAPSPADTACAYARNRRSVLAPSL